MTIQTRSGEAVAVDAYALGWIDDTEGAVLPPDLSEQQWITIGRYLYAEHTKVRWKVVEWLLYGSDHFNDVFHQIADKTGYAISTLGNYLDIGRKCWQFRDRAVPFSFMIPLKFSGFTPEVREFLVSEAEERHDTLEEFQQRCLDLRRSLGIAPAAKPAFTGGLSDRPEGDGLPLAPDGTVNAIVRMADDLAYYPVDRETDVKLKQIACHIEETPETVVKRMIEVTFARMFQKEGEEP